MNPHDLGRDSQPHATSGQFAAPHYFLWHFPLELLPWTIFVPAALLSLSDRMLKRRLLGWIVFVVALFSLFVTKRNIYILAAYPAAAMLIAAAWDDIPRLSHRWKIVTAGVASGLIWLLTFAAAVALFVPRIPFNRVAIIPSACVLLLGGLLMTRLTRREPLSERWFFAFCGVFFFLQTTVGAFLLPAVNELKGPVEAAGVAKAKLKTDEPVYLYNQQLAIFPLYAERPGRELHSIKELKRVISRPPHAVIVFREREWRDVESEIGESVRVLREFDMGHKRMVLVVCTDSHP